MSVAGSVADLRRQVEVAPTTPLNRLRAIGFSDEQARALAAADYDVIAFLNVHDLVGGCR